jgi:hypothetical protein
MRQTARDGLGAPDREWSTFSPGRASCDLQSQTLPVVNSTEKSRCGKMMGMRAIKTLVWILFVLPLALLFSLVGAMGKDLVVHWLTEVTAKALGVQVPDVAAIISKIWYVLPTAAAVATLYLYHIVQQAFFAPPPSPVFVQEPRSRTNIAINVIGTIAALTVLVFFVGTVLYFGYRE